MSTDHLALARDYIAIAESEDSKREAYEKAADELIAWVREEPTRSYRDADRFLGRGNDYCGRLVRWRTSGAASLPFGGAREIARLEEGRARRALADPDQRKQVISSMPTEALDNLQRETTEAVVERARAERQEHHTEPAPTVGQITHGEKFDPSESWADTLIIRANRNVRELSKHIERWGLVLGSMPEDEAFAYMQETERLAAEVRAAVQERARDGVEV